MTESNADYHADHRHIGSSMLRMGMEDPPLAEAIYVSHTMPTPDPSDDMVQGRILHCLLLEPDRFDVEYLVATSLDSRRGNPWKVVRDLAAAEGRTPILPKHVEVAEKLVATLRTHPYVKMLMEAVRKVPTAKIEEPLFAQDPKTGLWLKAKPDWFIPADDWFLLLDLKTAASLRQFRRSFWEHRYDLQLAFYRKVAVLAGKCGPHDKVAASWIVGVTSPPWRLVKRFYMSGDRLEQAGHEVDDALKRWATSLTTGVWDLPDADQAELIG